MKNKKIYTILKILIIIPSAALIINYFANCFINVVGNKSDVISVISGVKNRIRNDKDIVIVDLKNWDSHDILQTKLNIIRAVIDIKKCNPTVLGVDYIFGEDNKLGLDSILINELNCNNIVIPFHIDNINNEIIDSYFYNNALNLSRGYTNFYENIFLRNFSVQEKINNITHRSFTSKIAEIYGINDIPFKKYSINFRLDNFLTIDFENLKDHQYLLNNKIVLLGNTQNIEDLHQTAIGIKSGIEVHAYILCNMLVNSKITLISKFICVFYLLIIYFIIICCSSILNRNNRSIIKLFKNVINVLLITGITIICILLYSCNMNYLWESTITIPVSISIGISLCSFIEKFIIICNSKKANNE